MIKSLLAADDEHKPNQVRCSVIKQKPFWTGLLIAAAGVVLLVVVLSVI